MNNVSHLHTVSRPRLIVRVAGGVGNQLFTYAAARRLALVNDADLVIDDISGFERDYEYRRHFQLDSFSIFGRKATYGERLEPFARIKRKAILLWNKNIPFERRWYLTQEKVDYDPRLLSVHPKKIMYLEGYWQSEEYFRDIRDQLLSDLQISAPVESINLELARHMQDVQSVAVHFRFFDGLDARQVNNAPNDYYNRAFQLMEQALPSAKYFIFSDRPDNICGKIPLPKSRYQIVAHNQGDSQACVDLWLMSKCSHFIIANSTYSWWGAWLSRNKNKIVMAPGFEMRTGKAWWGFDGLLPESWTKIN